MTEIVQEAVSADQGFFDFESACRQFEDFDFEPVWRVWDGCRRSVIQLAKRSAFARSVNVNANKNGVN